MLRYFDFVSTGTYSGKYTNVESTSGTNFTVNGSICQPSDIVKIYEGTNWNITESLYFLNNSLIIKNLTQSDWTTNQKNDWLESFLKFVGLKSIISTPDFNTVLQAAEDINLFFQLSHPSIAYVNKDLSSGEISIGLNVYNLRFIIDLGNTLPNNSSLRNIIYLNHKKDTSYASNCAKVNYQGETQVVWCFGGISYNYDISNLPFTPSFTNGGGNIFGQVKMAGNGIQAKYILKKNIDPNDPTIGLCSGDGAPFCMGDEINLIDSTIWTSNFGTNGTGHWTWLADPTQLKYQWDIADITNPCVDYKYYSASEMKFPIRVIQFCEFDNFGYEITSFSYPPTITDIIVSITSSAVFWTAGNKITISDYDNINSYYQTDWTIISKGTDTTASNNINEGIYFRLRKTNFDNTQFQFPLVRYKIYLTF